jgi:hypothetical protein
MTSDFDALRLTDDTWKQEMELMARAGEVISCEVGHPIGIFTKDVHEGDECPNMIEWEMSDPPRPGDDLPLRCRCGAVWCKAVGEHLVIHIEGECCENALD